MPWASHEVGRENHGAKHTSYQDFSRQRVGRAQPVCEMSRGELPPGGEGHDLRSLAASSSGIAQELQQGDRIGLSSSTSNDSLASLTSTTCIAKVSRCPSEICSSGLGAVVIVVGGSCAR